MSWIPPGISKIVVPGDVYDKNKKGAGNFYSAPSISLLLE
jgi:hypothetical protein